MRILHLISSFRWTGVAEPAVQLAAAQRALGHDVLVAIEPGGELERRVRAAGLEVAPRIVSHRNGPLRMWRAVSRLRALARDRHLDVVHTHLTSDHWLAALAAGTREPGDSRAPRHRVLRTFHREAAPRRDPLTRWMMRRTDGAIAISRSLAARLRTAYRLDDAHLLVLGGVVDAEAFSPGGDGARLRHAWGVPDGAPVIGLLSRVRRARGVFDLFDAVAPLLRRAPDAYVVFCGRGRHAAALRRAIERHPHRERLRFPGYVPPAELRDAYAAFDIAVQLAPGNDGTCRAALQAMACGRPLVAAAVGALDDLLRDADARPLAAEAGGLLVPPHDADTLAAALAHYAVDPELRLAAGLAGRGLMEREHRIEAHAERVLAFYGRA